MQMTNKIQLKRTPLKKYILEFLAVFVGIIAAFGLEEWQENRKEREETVKALKYIRQDLTRDTTLYNYRLKLINRNNEYLELGALGNQISISDFKKLHKGLRTAVEYKVYDYGYHYLKHNLEYPILKNDTLMMWIGYYYSLSSAEGNYGRLNREYWDITSTNYIKLFENFPNFFNSDSILSNIEIINNIDFFFENPYWVGRINLTHRENRDLIKVIFERNKYFAEDILSGIEEEIADE